MEKTDYLIIGQGIAGTVLAFTLLEKGKNVLVVSDTRYPAASQVAAGLYNPVTGARLVKTWMADELFPFMLAFYQKLEKLLQTRFLFPTPLYRPFESLTQQNDWTARSAKPDLQPYLRQAPPSLLPADAFFHPFGGIETLQAGFVEVYKLLESARNYLKQKGGFVSEVFSFEDLEVNEKELRWKDLRPRRVVFCEGIHARHNPYFQWLPFRSAKGQLLTLDIKRLTLPAIVNQGVYLFQTPEGYFKAGATYDWGEDDWAVTEAGRNELCSKLEKLLLLPYQIVKQEAGIRSATPDRRPFAGSHPFFPRLGILNGLGSKGISQAPLLAYRLVEQMEGGKELWKEVQITRYKSLYAHSKAFQT
jgi:glycine/D-amino acid oxidase-like deaminating enzyme